MKRITINVDIDDNEVLSQSIRKALEDYAKQISREQFSQIIQTEIERVVGDTVRKYVSDPYSWTRQELRKKIDKAVEQLCADSSLARSDLREMIDKRLKCVDTMLSEYLARSESDYKARLNEFDKNAKAYIDARIDATVKNTFIKEMTDRLFGTGGASS